jgi:hypothetical protein
LRTLIDVRDDVLRLSDIEQHALHAGFRKRGRALHCAFHEDKNPSASLHKGRVHCFTCAKSWNPIDLTMQSHGCDFVTALRILADEYGIPWPGRDLISAARFERDAADLEATQYWRTALMHRIDGSLTDLKKLLQSAQEDDNEPEISELGERIFALTDLERFLRKASRTELLHAFRNSQAHRPELVEELTPEGRADDQDAREITVCIIRLLETASLSQAVAK